MLLALGVASEARAQLPARWPTDQNQPLRHRPVSRPGARRNARRRLAGAFVAIGEGVEGNTQNPAAPAVRVPWSNAHFDYDLGFGVTFPATLKNSDFFNYWAAHRPAQRHDRRLRIFEFRGQPAARKVGLRRHQRFARIRAERRQHDGQTGRPTRGQNLGHAFPAGASVCGRTSHRRRGRSGRHSGGSASECVHGFAAGSAV